VAGASLARQGGRTPDPIFAMKDHPTLTLGIVEVAFRARVQVSSRTSDAAIGDEDEAAADLARRRVGIEGSIGRYADFQVERELGDDIDPWRDVYINYSQFDQIQFQFGKFKQPFGLDENTGATNLDFAYRSLIASTLAPGRDRGYMVHGRLLDRTVRYELGKFDHDGSNARPKRPTDRVFGSETKVGRLSAVPFRTLKSPADEFEIGVAWASSDLVEGFSAIRGKTVFDQTFFSNDFLVLGRRKRLGFEARFRPGPVSIQAEYSRVTDERLGESVEDTDLSLLRGRGWYVSGTWALTGDSKADGLDATKRPLFQGGIGAVEVAARVERLTFDSMAAPNGSDPSSSFRADIILGNSNKVVTFGVNWYLNRWVKVQFNLIKETLDDPEQGPLPTEPSFSSRILKLQFTL
jgi:phosphate-selective porin OprO/OprP